MKRKISVIILMLIISFNGIALGYNHNIVESYIAYRIKYIHNIAYNSKIKLTKRRVKDYANSIVHWSDYYSREFGVSIDPLLVTAIIETETNFVSRSDYDNGESIGISSMRVSTAKWIANKINVSYNKWRMLDATDLGIRFTVYYLALGYHQYNNDINKIILSYNQGFSKVDSKDIDRLYNNYLFKVLGRYNYYKKRISSYGNSADVFFGYKLALLD